MLGLTNLHELAYGITSDNPHFGRWINPIARDRLPGGSSGGSAAAVAAGIVRAALGTDTAGSIRIPAACCGIVGFKPSYDAVPRAGVLDLAPSLDHVGPLGRSVADCAALFAALLGYETLPAWAQASAQGIRARRLLDYFDQPLDDDVRRAVREAMDALAADGALVSTQSIEDMSVAPAVQLNTIAPEASATHLDLLLAHGDTLGADVRVRLEAGLFLPAAWYAKAQRWRTRLVQRLDTAFEAADVLVCATLRAPAPRVGADRVRIGAAEYALHTAMTHLTLPFSLAGLPAVSLPWTASPEGAPIAVQLVGARGDDWRLLAVAERLERASPWWARNRADS